MRQEENQTYLLSNFQLDEPTTLAQVQAQYPNLIIRRIANSIYTVEVPPGNQQEFLNFQQRVKFVTLPILYGLNASAALDAANINVFKGEAFGALRGSGILIGFVDTGIQYTNNVFKNADNTTRIQAIWDQTIEGGPTPPNYDYGTVYDQAAINNALAQADPYTVVPSRDEIGHGTYLAGIAAGEDQLNEDGYEGGAPDAMILMVKLRPASQFLRNNYLIEPNAVAYSDNDIIAGVTYLVEEALRQQKPLVICIGVGSNYGAHNGTNIFERYLDTLSILQNIIIVIAAGNEGNLGHHYEGTIVQDETQEFEINVAEDSTGFPLYVWCLLPDKVTVSVKSPLGQVIERIPILPNQPQQFRFNLEQTRLIVNYIYPDPTTGGIKIEVKLERPTSGLWSVSIYGESIITGQFHVWLPQRGFIKEETRFLRATPDTTVQLPNTTEYTITVGAYDYVDGSIYIGSGRGPTTSGILKPDILAPGVNVEGPSLTGGTTTYVGTSTAAAITASAAVILMEWAVLRGNLLEMNTRIARGIFMRGAQRQRGVTYPNNIEGYGRLDLRASIASV